MDTVRPNQERAQLAIMLLWIIFIIYFLSLFSNFLEYKLLDKIANNGDYAMEEAENNDLRQTIVAVIFIIAYFISAFTFIRWFRRAYYNLHCRVKNLSETEDRAALYWFIPILNLYKPFRIMKELYTDTALYLSKKMDKKIQNNTTLLGAWWALWIISNFLGQLIFRLSNNADNVYEMRDLAVISMLSFLIDIPLVLLAIKVVKDYSKIEPIYASVAQSDIEHPSTEADNKSDKVES